MGSRALVGIRAQEAIDCFCPLTDARSANGCVRLVRKVKPRSIFDVFQHGLAEIKWPWIASAGVAHLIAIAMCNSNISASSRVDYKLMAKLDLFGPAGIMLKTMEESASIGIDSHGGPAWKAFAKALWAASKSRSGAA